MYFLFQLLGLFLVLSIFLAADAKFFKINTQQRPRCKQIYETIYTQQCSTTYAQQCNTVYETEYKTEYEQSCSTSYEQQCKQVYRDVPDKQCSTSYEQECYNEEQTTYETTYKDDCQSVPQQVSMCHFAISDDFLDVTSNPNTTNFHHSLIRRRSLEYFCFTGNI